VLDCLPACLAFDSLCLLCLWTPLGQTHDTRPIRLRCVFRRYSKEPYPPPPFPQNSFEDVCQLCFPSGFFGGGGTYLEFPPFPPSLSLSPPRLKHETHGLIDEEDVDEEESDAQSPPVKHAKRKASRTKEVIFYRVNHTHQTESRSYWNTC
jgi:hypothetical protein